MRLTNQAPKQLESDEISIANLYSYTRARDAASEETNAKPHELEMPHIMQSDCKFAWV